jgi:hypothetical protein
MFTLPLPWPEASLLLSPPWAGLPPAVRWILLAALVLAPLALLFTLYRYELRLVSRLTAVVLFSLRLVVLLLVLGLVCLQPIYAREHKHELPGRVLIAVDRSLSMDIRDPQRPASEKLRLARLLGLTKGQVGGDLFARWLGDYEQNRDPQLVLPEESADDPARRLKLQQERQSAHDRLLASVDDLTRGELARRLLADDGLKLLARVAERHEVELVGFNRDAFDLQPGQLAELSKPQDEKDAANSPAGFTDLNAPLTRARERAGAGQGKVIAVVLLTDGQHNAGAAPLALARELGERQIPVYPVALGARQSPPDAVLVSLRGPDYTVFKDVEAVFEVRFKIGGLAAQEFVLELFREGKEKKLLATRTIRHDGQDRLYNESIPVKMDEPGTQTITAVLRPVNAGVKELRTDNNRLSTAVSVADDRARVLLVDGEARWEYHYLATALSRDRLVDLEAVVFDPPRLDARLSDERGKALGLPARQWPAGPDALGNYQCILLGDVEPENLPLAQRQQLEAYVADSAGTLIILAGKRAMPRAYPETTPAGESDPLRRLLPIESPRRLSPEAGFALTLTQAGRETRYMELDGDRDENDALWAGFPRPWAWAVAGTAKPGATVLASWIDPRDQKGSPAERERQHAVFARQNYGFGRVLYVGVDSTWRWRYKAGDLYHHRFWGQVARWAAADRPLVVGNAFVRFGTPQPVYRPGEAVEVVARLSEALGKPRPDLMAGAKVVRPAEGKEPERAVALVPLTNRAGQPRVLEGKLRDLPPGRYAVELAIPEMADKLMAPAKEGEPEKPLRAAFTVLPPESRELIDLEMNLPLLEGLAQASGGRVFAPWEIEELEKLLVRQGLPHVERQEQRLWQWWGILAAVVVLLTAEWGLRKVAGLP